MVTTLYLVRHGAIQGSGMKRYQGSIDVPLSEEGIAQMRRTAKFIAANLAASEASQRASYLKDIHNPKIAAGAEDAAPRLSGIYSSDLSRAVRSADIISEPYGLTPVSVPALRERSFGIWEGMTFMEIKEKFPSEFDAWAANPLKYSPVSGENTTEVAERAVKAYAEIVERHNGENIAIVAHGGINRIILCHILGVPLENLFRVEQDYAAVNIIEFWDKYPVLKLLNGGALG